MICLGSAQRPPTPLEAEAAQLRMLSLFRADFLRRHVGGVVISELEYMGRTTAAPNAPGPLVFPGNPQLTQVMAALSADFRRWVRDRDYRKCDALGISKDALNAELMEVTTGTNTAAAVLQIEAKLAILRETVNRIHGLRVNWRPTTWRPTGHGLFYALPASPSELRYLCFVPTSRLLAPPGVVLYEVHIVGRPQVPIPVRLPDVAKEPLRDRYRQDRPTTEGAERWARQFLKDHPLLKVALQGMAAVAGVAFSIAAVVLLFDPVPGDEAAAAAAASALFAIALDTSQ